MSRIVWNLVPFGCGAGVVERYLSGELFESGALLFAFAAFQIADMIDSSHN